MTSSADKYVKNVVNDTGDESPQAFQGVKVVVYKFSLTTGTDFCDFLDFFFPIVTLY